MVLDTTIRGGDTAAAGAGVRVRVSARRRLCYTIMRAMLGFAITITPTAYVGVGHYNESHAGVRAIIRATL